MKSCAHWIGLLFIGTTCWGQNIDFTKENFNGKETELKEAQSTIKKGDELFYAGEHLRVRALAYYLKANDFNGENADLNYKIGTCYLFSSFKQKAIPYLEKSLRLNPSGSAELSYSLARAYHLEMQWDKAIAEYELSKTRGASQADSKKKITVTKKYRNVKTAFC